MKLYEKYSLPNNAEFVDIELETDNEKWIDPMMMHMDKSAMGIKCCQIVQEYFSTLLNFAIDGDRQKGYLYTKYFSEMNETRLGYSKNKPKGLSGGENLGKCIFDLIENSKAIDTELIGDIFDAGVMIEKFGIDKMSDFITSLIFEELIKFTQKQCLKYNIPTKIVKIKNKYWSYKNHQWKNGNTQLPYDQKSNMAIIFVPKKFVEKKLVYSHERFYNKAMIPYLGKEAVTNRVEGLIRILKDKTIKPLYKEIRKQNPCTKNSVNNFINNHQDVYETYKRKQMSYINYKNYKDK